LVALDGVDEGVDGTAGEAAVVVGDLAGVGVLCSRLSCLEMILAVGGEVRLLAASKLEAEVGEAPLRSCSELLDDCVVGGGGPAAAPVGEACFGLACLLS
jgi:hypothetical protein